MSLDVSRTCTHRKLCTWVLTLFFITSEESSEWDPKVNLYQGTVMALPLTLPMMTWESGLLGTDIGNRSLGRMYRRF